MVFDPEGIHRAVLNVVTNAIDAAAETGLDRAGWKSATALSCPSRSWCGSRSRTTGRAFPPTRWNSSSVPSFPRRRAEARGWACRSARRSWPSTAARIDVDSTPGPRGTFHAGVAGRPGAGDDNDGNVEPKESTDMKVARPAGRFFLAAASVLLLAPAAAAQFQGQAAAEDRPACEVSLGKHIETLDLYEDWHPGKQRLYSCRRVILEKHTEAIDLYDGHSEQRLSRRYGSIVFLPAGKYHVAYIGLEGGFVTCPDIWHSELAADRVELAPGRPYRFELKGPLTPSVSVKRVGGLLQLEYHLLDSDERDYRKVGDVDFANRPQFAIYQGDRRIGSGTFPSPGRESRNLPSWRVPLSVGNRDLRIVASQDIGSLGPKDGSPTIFHWRWYYNFPLLPCWAILLVLLLAPKANRNRQAYLILIPMGIAILFWRNRGDLLIPRVRRGLGGSA